MPHQCTGCGRSFADGSKEMLSGCPDCGGNKFQFKPAGASGAPAATDAERGATAETERRRPVDAERRRPAERSAGSSASTVESDAPAPDASADASTAAVERRSAETDQRSSSTERRPADAEREERAAAEDSAQADARSGMVREDELPPQPSAPDAADSEPEPTEEVPPDLAQLREELNDQFESIRILEPGQYELNLMELYDRNEYIISLREDGRYVIDVPDTWKD